VRIGRLGFVTGRQKMVLERRTTPELSQRTCGLPRGLQSCQSEWAGVAKRGHELICHPNPIRRDLHQITVIFARGWRRPERRTLLDAPPQLSVCPVYQESVWHLCKLAHPLLARSPRPTVVNVASAAGVSSTVTTYPLPHPTLTERARECVCCVGERARHGRVYGVTTGAFSYAKVANRNVSLRFGTGRQRMVLERWKHP
jgi:hypothetical protein